MNSRCECGCDASVNPPQRFVRGHNRRGIADLSQYTVADLGFTSPCWLWNGSLNDRGYGRIQIAGKNTVAHRAVYLSKGLSIPKGHELDHLCRRITCVNPDHLEPVTPEENRRRQSEAYTTCIRGHSLVSGDVRITRRGHRVCRVCAKIFWRRHGERRKQTAGGRQSQGIRGGDQGVRVHEKDIGR